MSRSFEMTVTLRSVHPDKLEAVQAAAEEEWGFDHEDWVAFPGETEQDPVWQVTAVGQLCGGEQDDEFAARLARAIWVAHGSYCDVTVTAVFLEV
jgi:hypothetical protein